MALRISLGDKVEQNGATAVLHAVLATYKQGIAAVPELNFRAITADL